MGVRGLTTYINNQNTFFHTFFLHNSSLVIDGHSLCCQLYRLLYSFSAFGGDYDKFSSFTKNFFKNLKKCNITCYVIFDGSYESRKLKTAYSRLRSKINGASRLDPVTQGSIQIFPLLLRDVFKEVLTELHISFTVCEFEADDEIAALARHLNCPVLSYDSDFFIYNVLYIPFNTLESKPKPVEENGNKYFVIECKIFKVENLISHFGGLKEEMLPLLATLLGNDYVEKKIFKNFFSHLKLPKTRVSKNDQQRSIDALFKWLQNETYDSALSKIMGRLKKSEKNKVTKIIKKSVDGYNNKYCRSLKYFNILNSTTKDLQSCIGKNYHTEDDCTDSSDSSSDEEEKLSDQEIKKISNFTSMPEWLAEGIRNNSIPQTYINLYTHHLHFCLPQAEDYTDNDSFLCALPLLRYAFDLLTDFTQETCIYVSREQDCNYKRLTVGIDYAIPQLLEKPFNKLTDDQKKSCFKNFIEQKLPNLDFDDIFLLPLNFQLYMISILWWVSNCSVPTAHIYSLLLCYIMLEVIDEKTGSYRGYYHFNKKYSQKIDELRKKPLDNSGNDEIFLNKNKVLYEDCLIAADVLLKYFEIDEVIRKKPKSYDTKRVHSFAQFQCCLQQFNALNVLCCNPFESTKYSNYNGTFVYNVAQKLDNQGENFKNFTLQHLKSASSILKFFNSLFRIYEKCAQKMSLKTQTWIGKKQRSRRKGENSKMKDEISFIVKSFESEVVI